MRALAPRHRRRILAHLLSLDESDRYLRFGFAAGDSHIERYVEQLDFERDEIFGVFNRRLELVAMMHLAYLPPDAHGGPTSAEFGVAVSQRMRGRGLGARLFDLAVLHARNRGVGTLVIHALSENTPMLRIARAAGATLEREGADSTARLKLPPEDISSHLAEMVEAQAAEFDYRFKVQARRFGELADSLRALLPSGGGDDRHPPTPP